MKMSELEGDELDHAVARALGGELDGDGWRFDPPLDLGGEYGSCCTFIKTKRSFCRDWTYGGPIIDREGIAVAPLRNGKTQEVVWFAWHEGKRETWHDEPNQQFEEADGYFERSTGWHKPHGSTPLIAAMRAFVASKLDEEEFD